jgi:two-component system, NtrC family, response regulator PilR
MKSETILIVDDDAAYRDIVKLLLEDFYQVQCAAGGDEALALLSQQSFSLVLLDVMMPGMPGLDVLKIIKSRWPETQIVMITVISDLKSIVDSIRQGAHDYIVKGCTTEEILHRVNNVFEKINTAKKLKGLMEDYKGALFGDMLIGPSETSQHMLNELNLAAQCDATCLITGETGSGKGVAAAYIHRESARSSKPFVTVNLPTVPRELMESVLFGAEGSATGGDGGDYEGKFELADGGTILLDEIGELSPEHQARLLRIIEDREFERVGSHRKRILDVRILTTTSFDLEKRIEERLFRKDLYYRLKVFPIAICSLRERVNDIRPLAMHFLEMSTKKYRKEISGFSEEVFAILESQPWRGNIRELSHLIERMVIYTQNSTIEFSDLPIDYIVASQEGENGDALMMKKTVFEKQLIHRALIKNGYNKSRTARELGMPVETLRYRIKILGLANGEDKSAAEIQN